MTTSDIIVGKEYRFIEDFNHNTIMLGIGMRKLYTGINNEIEFTEKHLVIIKDSDPFMVGRMIQEGENVYEGFWDRIVEKDCGTYLMQAR